MLSQDDFSLYAPGVCLDKDTFNAFAEKAPDLRLEYTDTLPPSTVLIEKFLIKTECAFLLACLAEAKAFSLDGVGTLKVGNSSTTIPLEVFQAIQGNADKWNARAFKHLYDAGYPNCGVFAGVSA
jgi:hypothetical protein